MRCRQMLALESAQSPVCGADCACRSCMARCDAEAASGRIPLNASWWMTQKAFSVEMPRVDEFFAEVRR